jgi:hypothetical protein
MKFKLDNFIFGYILLAILMIACVTVEEGPISNEYLKSLSVYRKDSNSLDISDKSECLTITKNMLTYNPIYTFRQCLVQRGYVLLN